MKENDILIHMNDNRPNSAYGVYLGLKTNKKYLIINWSWTKENVRNFQQVGYLETFLKLKSTIFRN